MDTWHKYISRGRCLLCSVPRGEASIDLLGREAQEPAGIQCPEGLWGVTLAQIKD